MFLSPFGDAAPPYPSQSITSITVELSHYLSLLSNSSVTGEWCLYFVVLSLFLFPDFQCQNYGVNENNTPSFFFFLVWFSEYLLIKFWLWSMVLFFCVYYSVFFFILYLFFSLCWFMIVSWFCIRGKYYWCIWLG